MAIGSVVQNGAFINVYDEKGHQIATIQGGPLTGAKNDGLVGYTSSTVNVRIGSFIKTYDEKGHELSSIFAG